MFESHGDAESRPRDLEPELLQTLERQKSEEIARQRLFSRIDTKLKVVVRPANSSQLLEFKVQGLTADISRGGTRLILPLPLGVGDVYRLEFDTTEHKLPLVFGRCLRCRLLREDAFEVGVQFFAQIELPPSLFGESNDLLS
ncbi:MAG: PilZ domain-containing protein [Planctomycetes bacterium]|nr:PilZ domain-containing protein [Planctomycetota bacterium]